MHILLALEKGYKPRDDIDIIDSIISCESEPKDKELFEKVKMMVHTTCKKDKKGSCVNPETGRCTAGFPKPLRR